MQDLTLPPSVTVGPTAVGVSIFTDEGATVMVSLPRPRGLHDIPENELVDRARVLAKRAMMSAAEILAQ